MYSYVSKKKKAVDMVKKKCLGCGKPTSMGVPYTICPKCARIIERFMNVRDNYHNAFREIKGIEQVKFEGKGDTIFNLNCAFEHVAEIEERLEWLKNCLLNISHEEQKTQEMYEEKNQEADTNGYS